MKKNILIVFVSVVVAILFNIYGGKIDFVYAENTKFSIKEYFGKYDGSVKTEWLKDGRKMRLLESIAYIDLKGVEWIAPVGFVLDGASIPQFFWSLVGGPYEGKYRDASVIHDAACFQRLRSWESVHEAFYYAMLTSGVDSVIALEFYAAVYHYGPRWSIKYEEKNVLRSTAKGIISNIKSEATIGSLIKVSENKISRQPNKVDLIVIMIPPKPRLEESDFVELKNLIEKRMQSKIGPMSLEEIRNYHPLKS